MKKILSGIMALLLIAGTTACNVFDLKSALNDKTVSSDVSEKITSSDAVVTPLVNYEDVYLNYISENEDFFTRGMMLCDLNSDSVPELFSIAYDEGGDVVYYHEFDGNVVKRPSIHDAKTYVSIHNLVNRTTFYEDVNDFIGMYKNKRTGQQVIINSIADGSENDRLDIITYSGSGVVMIEEGIREMVGGYWPVREKRDEIMADYELSEEKLHAKFLMRGEYGSEYGKDPTEDLKALIDEFKNYVAPDDYETVRDGEFYCYVKNINIDKNEIVLVPVAEISYEEYTAAVSGNKVLNVNGTDMYIKESEPFYSELGIAEIFDEFQNVYEFYIPQNPGDKTIIKDYIGKRPVKIKFGKDTMVRKDIIAYTSDGDVSDRENSNYAAGVGVKEYSSNYAVYNNGNYFKAIVKNGELQYLDSVYKP